MSEEYTKEDYLAELSEEDQQFDDNGICIFCNKHKEESYHYKCWLR